MQVLHAFQEVGYALLAVTMPIVLATLILKNYRDSKAYLILEGYPERFYQGSHGKCSRALDKAKLEVLRQSLRIYCMLLVLNIISFTIPFGHAHGWW